MKWSIIMMVRILSTIENIFGNFKIALTNLMMISYWNRKKMLGVRFVDTGNPMVLREIQAAEKIFGMTINCTKLSYHVTLLPNLALWKWKSTNLATTCPTLLTTTPCQEYATTLHGIWTHPSSMHKSEVLQISPWAHLSNMEVTQTQEVSLTQLW